MIETLQDAIRYFTEIQYGGYAPDPQLGWRVGRHMDGEVLAVAGPEWERGFFDKYLNEQEAIMVARALSDETEAPWIRITEQRPPEDEYVELYTERKSAYCPVWIGRVSSNPNVDYVMLAAKGEAPLSDFTHWRRLTVPAR